MYRLLLSAAPDAESAALTVGERLSGAWDSVVYGLSWFFGKMEPAGVWAIPALAAVIAFYVYFWKVSAPRKNSLEWIAMAEEQPRRMTRRDRCGGRDSETTCSGWIFWDADQTAAKPFSRSARMSSMCSVPMESRMVAGVMP